MSDLVVWLIPLIIGWFIGTIVGIVVWFKILLPYLEKRHNLL